MSSEQSKDSKENEMFIKFEGYDPDTVVLNTRYIARVFSNSHEWQNVYLSGGTHIIVRGTLDEVIELLAGDSR